MGKLEELDRKYRYLESRLPEPPSKKGFFRFPMKAKRVIKSVKKKPQTIVTQYLGQDGQMKFRVCPIVSGNIIVVNNKAHEINPKEIWKYGKLSWYIHREISRKAVSIKGTEKVISNQDYDKVKERKEDTDSDVVLIKAVLGAIMKPKKEIKKGVIIWIIVAVVLGILGFALFGGNGGAV